MPQRLEQGLFVDGQPQEIETFESVNSALSVVLVLDQSSSMALKLRNSRGAALEFDEVADAQASLAREPHLIR